MADPRFEFLGEEGDHRWRLRAGNGEIIASGEGFTRPDDALRGVETVISTVLEIASKSTLTIDA
jgi:uncharacterized protein YegP (UPF0339 family)